MNFPNDKCTFESDQSNADSGLGCQRIEERIHDLLDQRRSPLEDRIVKVHCDDCRQCADLVSDFDALGNSLLRLPVGVRPVEVSQRDSNLKPLMLVASISCLLLVMLTPNVWLPSFGGSEGVAEVASVVAPIPVMGTSEPVHSFNLLDIADNAISSEELLNTVGFAEIGSQVEPYQDYLGVTAELPGFEPIRESVNLAIQFFNTLSRLPAAEDQPETLPDGPNVGFGVQFPTDAWA